MSSLLTALRIYIFKVFRSAGQIVDSDCAVVYWVVDCRNAALLVLWMIAGDFETSWNQFLLTETLLGLENTNTG